jgi:hypothetical protein
MAALRKAFYSADVYFYGTDGRDEGARAWVEAKPPPEIRAGCDALSLLVPLLGANYIIGNAQTEPAATDGFAAELRSAADRMLEGEDEARDVTYEGEFAGVPMAVLAGESEGGSEHVLTTALMRGRGREAWWARSRAPFARGAYFEPIGHLMLVQHAARTAPHDALMRMAMGIRVALAMYETVSDYHNLPGLLTVFNEGVASIVLATDPVAEWKQRREGGPGSLPSAP